MKELTRCTNTPEQDLLNAIVQQAAEEHRAAFVKLLRKPDDVRAKRLQKEAESFFLSEDFEIFTKVAGSYLLRKLREEEEKIAAKLSAFQKARSGLQAVWAEYRISGNTQLLEDACALRNSIIEAKSGIPRYARKLFRLSREEYRIFMNPKKWERKNGAA